MINLDKVSEGVHYELIPNLELEEAWAVQVIRGEYTGLGFLYEDITFDGKTGQMSFRVSGVNLETKEPVEVNETKIEDFAFEILEDIVKNSIASGSIQLVESDSDES